jgi:hypothetical protein
MSEPNKDGTDIMMALLVGLSGPRASKAWNESQQIKAESFLTMAEHWINQTAEENARLKAEVDRLEHQVNYWRIEAEVDNARWLRCLQDLEELRASSFVTAVPAHQYERIVKAGDAMAERLMYQGYPATVPAWNAAKNGWNAAKEGKQS